MVKPSEVGVMASPQTPMSYGASASSRILANTEGRRPNACTATARSRTNVPPSTIIATRWRANRCLLGRIRGNNGLQRSGRREQTWTRIAAWNPTPSSSYTASGSRPVAGRTGSPTTRRRGTASSRRATRASRSRSRRCARTLRSSSTSPCLRSSTRSRRRSAISTSRRSSWGTPPAARSPRSCSTTASALPGWRSTPHPPRA